jgi:hypothetical protein
MCPLWVQLAEKEASLADAIAKEASEKQNLDAKKTDVASCFTLFETELTQRQDYLQAVQVPRLFSPPSPPPSLPLHNDLGRPRDLKRSL